MTLLDLIGSQRGRAIRAVAGAGLIASGVTGHGKQRLLIVVGLVPLLAGGLDVCILGPLVGRPARGDEFRRSASGPARRKPTASVRELLAR